MKIDVDLLQGFSKLTKIKDQNKTVELPTTMKLDYKKQKWFIGNSSNSFSLNYPLKSFNSLKIDTVDCDFIFLANFLMQKGIDKSIIDRQLKLTKKALEDSLSTIPTEKALILIHPTDHLNSLKEILSLLIELGINNIAISDLFSILTNPRELVDFFGCLRYTLPITSILYLFSPIPHTFMPILTYLGIDVFNADYANIASKEEIYLTDHGGNHLSKIKENTCFCPYCNQVDNLSNLLHTNEQGSLLEKHNYLIVQKKMGEIRSALKNQDLRGFVERVALGHITSAAILKLLDKNFSKELLTRTSAWQSTKIYPITSYSFNRPEIVEFLSRINNRYQIPKTKKLIVIVPCSAKKPYSESKSHKLFLNVLNAIPNEKRGLIQELILTSPLGVIPRELENIFPAAHYDLPVTGDWSFEEKQIAISQLFNTLQKAQKFIEVIIAHVSEEYLELCETVEKKLHKEFIYTTKNDKPTSSSSLTNLSNELNKALINMPSLSWEKDVEKLQAIANYQFGLDIGGELFKNNFRIKKKPFQDTIILYKGKHFGIQKDDTGQLVSSPIIGKLLAEKGIYNIIFDGNEVKGSTLFAVGVKDADQQIKPSDEIVIVNKQKQLLAIGQAIVSGYDMKIMKNGPVAKIKLKIE